jgi:hypothetical protein
MRYRTILFASAFSCCALFALYSEGVFAENSKKSGSDTEKSFGDGVLMLYTERTSGIEGHFDSQYLKDARLVNIGDRYFVRGKAVIIPTGANYEAGKWLNGVDTAIEWKSVYHFYMLPQDKFDGFIEAVKPKEEE